MNKNQLRKYYKAKRNEFSIIQQIEASKNIAHQVVKKWNFKHKRISIFLPIARLTEVDTRFIITELKDKNRLCAPVSDFENHSLKHVELSDESKFHLTDWGIPEPTAGVVFPVHEIDVVLVPLLISDTRGFRLGYGKGFYDRFLSQCNEKTVFIGLNYFEPIPAIPELNEFDIPLHFLVTPKKVIEYN